MKKKIVVLLLLGVVCLGMTAFCPVSASEILPIQLVGPDIEPGGGSMQINSIDISSSSCVSDIKDFSGFFHSDFGRIQKISDSTAYDWESRIIYNSFWTGQDSVYEEYETFRYDTYTFENYVDLPVRVLYSRKLPINETATFTLETTDAYEETVQTTSKTATQFYWEFCSALNFSTGNAISLSDVNSSGSQLQSSAGIKIGGTFANEIENYIRSSVYYSVVYRETYYLDNRNSDREIYFDLNFRQKFKIYFTTKYQYNYETKQWGSGAFGWDQHWEYDFKNYTPIGTYVFLIPMDSPYFEISRYYDNASGRKELIPTSENDHIVYM